MTHELRTKSQERLAAPPALRGRGSAASPLGLLFDKPWQVTPISITDAGAFIARHHYMATMPAQIRLVLGFYDECGLAGAAVWGIGLQRVGAIRSCFPSLNDDQYLLLLRLCCRDDLPRNTESWFLARCVEWIKAKQQNVKVLMSLGDGMRGKIGYVYQAANWLHVETIKSYAFLSPTGQWLHPRVMVTRYKTSSVKFALTIGMAKVEAPFFRYLRFTCGNAERKRLMAESSFKWGLPYPKASSLWWEVSTPYQKVKVLSFDEVLPTVAALVRGGSIVRGSV